MYFRDVYTDIKRLTDLPSLKENQMKTLLPNSLQLLLLMIFYWNETWRWNSIAKQRREKQGFAWGKVKNVEVNRQMEKGKHKGRKVKLKRETKNLNKFK